MTVTLRHQFCISTQEDTVAVPSHFSVSFFAGYRIATCPSLPVTKLLNTEGQCIGLVLGWASQGKQLLSDRTLFGVDPDADWETLEDLLYCMGGRWLALISLGSTQRVYLDSLASHSAVYCKSSKRLASTPALLKSELAPLLSNADLTDKDYWYPAGLTAHRGVSRVLANHCVELNTYDCLRHWPRPDSDLTVSDKWRRDVDSLANLIQQQFAAYAAKMPIRIGLTAGLESRVMLACSRKSSPAPLFWTRSDKTVGAYQDVKTSSLLARQFSLQHEVLPFKEKFKCSDTDIRQFLADTGYCVGGSPLRSYKLIDSAGECFAFTGIGGEIARAYYYENKQPKDLSAHALLVLAQLPLLTQFIEATERYLKTLPNLEVHQQLALFYLENRVSAFGSVHRYAYQSGIVFMSPFSHRSIVSSMLTLPLQDQIDAQFHKALIKHSWPEVSSVPFNAPLDIKDKFYSLYERVIRRL